MSLEIIKYPHPTLRHKSKPLKRVDAELRRIVAEMFDKMYEAKGIGLAANQVDLPYRLFVLNISGEADKKDEELVFINPMISGHKGSAEAEEGCLSLPGLYAPVRRAERVVIRAYDLSGTELEYEASGLFARAAQHEHDHIDGVLFVDRLQTSSELAVRDQLAQFTAEFLEARERGEIPPDEAITQRLAELEALRT